MYLVLILLFLYFLYSFRSSCVFRVLRAALERKLLSFVLVTLVNNNYELYTAYPSYFLSSSVMQLLRALIARVELK